MEARAVLILELKPEEAKALTDEITGLGEKHDLAYDLPHLSDLRDLLITVLDK